MLFNFLYWLSGEFCEVLLVLVSWRNFCGYLVLWRLGFVVVYCDDVIWLIVCVEKVVFFVGSLGLELFNNFEFLEVEEWKCLLICFGLVV